MNSRGASMDQQQFFPVPPQKVWEALQRAIPAAGLYLKNADQMLMRVEVSSGMSAMTWGQNFAISVQPGPNEGCYLTIVAASKFPAARDRARMQKIANEVIAKTSSILQA
jgi:hypothetical protein